MKLKLLMLFTAAALCVTAKLNAQTVVFQESVPPATCQYIQQCIISVPGAWDLDWSISTASNFIIVGVGGLMPAEYKCEGGGSQEATLTVLPSLNPGFNVPFTATGSCAGWQLDPTTGAQIAPANISFSLAGTTFKGRYSRTLWQVQSGSVTVTE